MTERSPVYWVDRGGRTRRLRDRIVARDLVLAMAAHSPLSARLAAETGFDAIWASGFELSALYGVPDESVLTMQQHLVMTRAIAAAVDLPVIADVDTGFGDITHTVTEYQRVGASAVVVEDKVFPKRTSLDESAQHELVSVTAFEGKLRAACAARVAPEFLVIARTEALIAGLGQAEALTRAHAYATAGADAVLVHSKARTAEEIESVARAWDGAVPLVIVPTAYPEMDAARARRLGNVAMMIFGNHGIRASVAAMRTAFAAIRQDGGTRRVEPSLATVADVMALQSRSGAVS